MREAEGGGAVTVENGGVIIDSAVTSIDFSGTYFVITPGAEGQVSVTLATNSITDSNISAGAAIQLSKLEKDPSQPGTINLSTNPVDWSQLKNVPAGFADGVDNLGAGMPTVEKSGVPVDTAATTFNFLGPYFDITSSPPGQANISLDASTATLQGNSFNGANQLVQLNGSSQLPAVSAVNLTSIPAAQLSGTVPSSTLDSSSVTKQEPVQWRQPIGPAERIVSTSGGERGESNEHSGVATNGNGCRHGARCLVGNQARKRIQWGE